MQAHVRLTLALLLLAFARDGRPQPPSFPPPADATAPVTNPAPNLRQRFTRRTNQVIGNTNSIPVTQVPAPAAATNTAAITPQQDNRAVTNVTVFNPNNAPNPANNPSNAKGGAPATTVATPGPATLPVPGGNTAAQPATASGRAPARPPTPIIANTSSTNSVIPAPSPVNPVLNEADVIPAGTIALQGMAIDQFFDIYAQYSGRTILRPYALPAPQGLTLKSQTDLTRREVVEAMDGVLALNNITMIPVGDKFVKAVPSNMADKEGMAITTASASEMPMAEQFVTKIVKLKTAKPTELAPTLQGLAKTATAVTPIDSNQTLILRDYASNVRRMLEIIEKIDVTPESDFTLEVLPIKYGKVGDIYATMAALIQGGGGAGGVVGGTTAGTAGTRPVGGFGSSRGGFGGAGGANRFGTSGGYSPYGGGYGGSSYGGGYRSGYGGYSPMDLESSKVTPQQVAPGASPGAAQGSFQQRLNQIVNKAANPDQVKILENAQIVPDDRSNKLLIFSNKRDMAMITNIVHKLDVMLAQVLIEAIILEVKLGDSLKLGVSFAQNPKQFGKDFSGAGAVNNSTFLGSLTNFPSGTPSGFSYFGTIKDDFSAAINAIAQDNEINIISRPRIQTSHAIPGFFFIGETVPYVTGVYDYGYAAVGGSLATRSQIQQQEIGLSLDVTPFITPEGMVVMEIGENFQQRGQDVIIDGNPIPLVNTRQASATLTVRNGDIIMLGGFITESRSKSKSGVPLLKDIPGLGALFRTTNNQNDRTELILLMRATVLDTPESAAFLAETERLQLPGVRKAEKEFEQAEAQRLQKVERSSKKK